MKNGQISGWERYSPGGGLTLRLCAIFLCLSAGGCSTVVVQTQTATFRQETIDSARQLRGLPFSVDSPDATLANEVGRASLRQLRTARRQEIFARNSRAEFNYLNVAMEVHRLLESGDEFSAKEEKKLLQVHNQSLARFAELWSGSSARENGGRVRLEAAGETIEVEWNGDSAFAPDYFDRYVAADAILGKGVNEKGRHGFGAPLVGIREKSAGREEEMKNYPDRGLHLPVTLAVSSVEERAEPQGVVRVVSLALHDPTRTASLALGSRRYPLAANYSAPIALLLQGRNELIWGLRSFVDASGSLDESGIFLLQPYDPDRIPVILTHGLISVPIIWRDLIPEFLSDPEIASRYQFMVFTYPSSFPITDSFLLFRQELAALRAHYDPGSQHELSKDVVAIGHSMGGVLSHLLISEVGDRLWSEFSDLPLSEMGFSPEVEQRVRELTYYSPDTGVKRAVFLSTPHGGATLATIGIADWAPRLVKLPGNVLVTTLGVLEIPEVTGLKVNIGEKVTSIQSLRPDSPVVMALQSSPRKPGVRYHSIIGDRGREDTPDSSDGVVEYWSSHLEGAESELIVPTGHTSYKHPSAVEELKRILKVHAGG